MNVVCWRCANTAVQTDKFEVVTATTRCTYDSYNCNGLNKENGSGENPVETF